MKKIVKLAEQKKYFLLFVGLIGIPALIISVALVALMVFNFSCTKEILTDNAVGTLSRIAKASDNKFNTIVDATGLIKGNPTLNSVLSDPESTFDGEVAYELNTMKGIYTYIDNIYIINQNTGMVCDTDGVFDIDNFFNNKYRNRNYNAAYWKDFRFYNTTDYSVLSPTIVSEFGEEKVIIPIIFRRVRNFNMKNKIVYNIDLKQLIDYDIEENGKSNMSIYLLNRYTNEVFFSDGTVISPDYFPKDFYAEIIKGTNHSFDYTLPGGKKIVTVYSKKDTLTGYSYFSLLDKKIIYKQLLPGMIVSILIFLVFLIAAFMAVFRNAMHIFTPMNEIYNVLPDKNESDGGTGNMFDDIKRRAYDMVKTNEMLNATLSCAQEKYLIDYLNATEYYIDEAARDIIRESLSFPNEYFMVVIIRLSPTAQLFNQYNSVEYANIQSGFYNIVKELFISEFPSYVLPGAQETLYIILNLKEENESENADRILENINELLKNDINTVHLSIGKSKAYKGIEGLKQAHTEATEKLTLYSATSDRIMIDARSEIDFDFGCREESDLFTALLSANKKKVYELLNITLERNKSKSHNTQKHLYISIMNIAVKAMKLKSLDYPDDKTDEEVMEEFTELPLQEMKRYMMLYIEKILEFGAPSAGYEEADGNINQSIISYIEENYSLQGLSLDYLAEYFHMSQSRISVIIKNSLGMGFHEYITTLRVNKAKTLLLTTNKTISDIAAECGFSSQQTFFRSFKKITGQTTTQIRSEK